VRQSDRVRSQLWSFAFLAVRRVLSLAVLVLRSSTSKEIEILVLRHELEILRRSQPRPRLEPTDRVWLAALSGLLQRERWSAFSVRPETLLRAPPPRHTALDISPPSTGTTRDPRRCRRSDRGDGDGQPSMGVSAHPG
jgi:hypothetical protein